MISQNISIDKLIEDIDQQIEILFAIAGDNAILSEQLRLLQESREVVLNLMMEIERLEDMIDPDEFEDHSTMIDRKQESD